jgi:NhaP-type Na+/H+ or K+/H+ antiporter
MQPTQTDPRGTIPQETIKDTFNPSQSGASQRIPYWLQQAERFLRVLVRIYLGLLVCFAPWYPPAWDANPLFSQSPWLMNIITHGAVRGIVSGLGLLNLWIALRDLLRPPADPGPR